MKKSLLDVIFASEKRKQTLLLLHEGAKKMEDILISLNTTRTALLPQMKILGEHYLVSHYGDTYELTTIGKLLVDDMVPLINKLEILDADIDYWGTHILDFIPPYLLKRMSDLQKCEIVNPPMEDLYSSVHKPFRGGKKMPDHIYTITAFLYPNYYSIFTEVLESAYSSDFIVSQELLAKIKAEHREHFQDFLKSEIFRMYVYNKEMDFFFITFDDNHLLMSLLKSNRDFDTKYILCSTDSALEWTKELFDHFLENSTRVTEI